MQESVYQTIMWNQNGIMNTMVKDDSGDEHCPINGQLDGVFFCAKVNNYTKEPKEPSPYGDT